ncbi:unnamed protein product [Prorocentrum cordatum]|uniref:Uncharacterized protein n=1 Tax=Prorocentrum cordatum TaxID=2364126 RepID=A0ABN9X3M7_9DINO|nr:unnamed protein product [Polarella glacialis]
MHRPHGSRPLLADRGPAARRALGIAPRRGARRRAPRRPQRSGPPPPMGLEWRALHACAAGAPAGRAARGGPAAEPIAVQAAALLEEEWPRPAGVPGRLARFRRSCEAFPAHYVVLSAPDAEGATRGEAGEEASSPGSSESSRGVGLPVGGAGVGGGEHCDPVVVGHCALRETTTAGAGAGSAGACAVLCSVVVRPELRSVRRGPLHTSRITEEVKVPISLPFARFSLCWASSEALVATVGFASKFLSGRTPGKVQGVAVPVPSGFPRIGCC